MIRVQAALLCALGFALYANTLGHGYTLDDGVVILENAHVQAGVAGIGAILTRDAFDSYYRRMGVDPDQLPGGRYRPLSIVSFAVEQQFFGDRPFQRHLVNVLLYVGSIVVLLGFLRHLMPKRPAAAFTTALLFLVHPLHTEVVANVKSRDEILSFLFVVLTLWLASSRARPVLALVSFFLALLSKEYGIVLLGLLPLLFYVRGKDSQALALRRTLPFLGVAGLYGALRVAAVGLRQVESPEVLSNPYLYATAWQELATKIDVLGRYVRLLVFPHPLSSDYGYRQIPYVDFSDPTVSLWLLAHLGLLVAGFWWLRRRSLPAFAIGFYAACLLPVSNLLVNVGAFMGERLAYHASFGFVLGATLLGAEAVARLPQKARTPVAATLLAALVLAAGMKTIDRNRAWKNDGTLFTTDVRTVPNSALANTNAGLHFLRLADLPEHERDAESWIRRGLTHLDRAVEIHPRLVNAYVNRGLGRFKLADFAGAEADWLHAKELQPGHPMLQNNLLALSDAYYRQGLDLGSRREFGDALPWFDKATRLNPDHPPIWVNKGKAHYWLGEYAEARNAWNRALKLDPTRQDAMEGLRTLRRERK